MSCRIVRVGWMLGVSLGLTLAQNPGSQNDAKEAQPTLERLLRYDSSVVKRRYPDAQLFQVSIFGLVPKALSDQKVIENPIQSSYVIAKDRYVEAIQRGIADLEAVPEIIEKAWQPEPCQKGYPLAGSQVCTSETGRIQEQPRPLHIAEVSKLMQLPNWLAKAGFDPSDPYDVTITTAGRLNLAIASSPTSIATSQVSTALTQLKPDQTAFSVTVRSGDHAKIGSTLIFDAGTGEMIGRYQITRKRLPPSAGR